MQHPLIGHAIAVQHQNKMLADAQNVRNLAVAQTECAHHAGIRRLLRLVRRGARRRDEDTSTAANPVARQDVVA